MKKPNWREWLNNKEECEYWLDNYLKKKIIKEVRDESKLHIKRTDHNITFANWIIEKHKKEIPEELNETYYDWVISIYYYAIYHAALALINKAGVTSKNHTATLAFVIHHHYHKQQTLKKEEVELIASSLDKEDIEIIGFSKELREKACYDVHEQFEKRLVEQIREQTINFVNKTKEILKN